MNSRSPIGTQNLLLKILKNTYQRAEPADGTRILTMRYWPRGVRKDQIDEWMRDLAPSPELLNWCWANQGDLPPDTYAKTWVRRYRKEMAQKSDVIEELCQRLRTGETMTLLCGCHDPVTCHRSVLADIINAKLAEGTG